MPVRSRYTKHFAAVHGHSLLRHQLLLCAIAFAVGIVFWFFQGTAGFITVFIYTFVIGNFTAVAMAATADLVRKASTLLCHWIIFLALLIPIGLIGGTLASLTIYLVQPALRGLPLLPFLVTNVRIGLFVTIVVACFMFAGSLARARLEAANRLLEDQVQLGAIRLQDQAAELTTAHEIQAHLIPTSLPQMPGLQVSGAWQPAQAVGGDYFDVLTLDPAHLALALADVSGKGMGAALLMANLQAAFRAFATPETRPGELCAKLNRALCSSIAPGKFVTFFYAVLDTARLLLSYENAGHNPPTLLRGDTVVPVPGGSMVLGLFTHVTYSDRAIQLAAGDCLLLTTDGITEAAHPDNLDEEFGERRLIESARAARTKGAHAVRTRILEDVTRFCEGHFQDDASLIVLTIDA